MISLIAQTRHPLESRLVATLLRFSGSLTQLLEYRQLTGESAASRAPDKLPSINLSVCDQVERAKGFNITLVGHTNRDHVQLTTKTYTRLSIVKRANADDALERLAHATY